MPCTLRARRRTLGNPGRGALALAYPCRALSVVDPTDRPTHTAPPPIANVARKSAQFASGVRMEGASRLHIATYDRTQPPASQVVTTEKQNIVAVGPIGHVTEGQHLVLSGRWVNHATHGRQLKVDGILVEDPRTTRGLERYLGSGAVTGLGRNSPSASLRPLASTPWP